MSVENNKQKPQQQPVTPSVSEVLDNGGLLELVYDDDARRTAFVHAQNGAWQQVKRWRDGNGEFVPYKASNNLIRHKVVLLPSEPLEYGTVQNLIEGVRTYIHRYVDLSEWFEQIATYYVLLSWIYDGFNELPYLRVRGDYGTGKTRFLLVVGSICYKPIFASGASTVAPIFHTLDRFRGTLVIDEADFRFSDEKADIVKIFNNGNVKGLPVLRVEVSPQKEFNPRAYDVFGPKLVASRNRYEDRALESRFISEEMGMQRVRPEVPINLPDAYRDEALLLRNKLLLYRLRNFGARTPDESLIDRRVEPRLNQIFVPLLSTVSDERLRRQIGDVRARYQEDSLVDRSSDVEAMVLRAIKGLLGEGVYPAMKVIADRVGQELGDKGESSVTPKRIGGIVRRKLGIRTVKSNGVFVIPPEEAPRLAFLYERYGINGTETLGTSGM